MTDIAFKNQALGINEKTYRTVKDMAPPSPQLSQDDLMSHLVVDGKENAVAAAALISPISSTGLQSPASCHSPKDQTVLESTAEVDYQIEDDIGLMLYIGFIDLIYWDIPGRSGIVLAGILSSLVLTRYYSLIYVFAASLTILTGFNLIFVNAYNLIRRVWTGRPIEEFTHPYHIHIGDHRFNLVSRDMIVYYVDKCIDVLELITQQTAKIIYVENSKVTAVAFLCSGFIYVATGLIPTKVFFGLFVLALFTVPYFYEQYEDEVDLYWVSAQDSCQQIVTEYGQLVRSQSSILVANAKTLWASLVMIVQDQLQKRTRQKPQDRKMDAVMKVTLPDQ